MQQLAALHQELRSLITQLAAETAKAQPDIAAISSIRMRLSQASRARATRLESISAAIRDSTTGRYPDLARVIADGRQARLHSGAHIGKWTLKALEADWKGYCADSTNMRAAMLKQIDEEARALNMRAMPASYAVAYN